MYPRAWTHPTAHVVRGAIAHDLNLLPQDVSFAVATDLLPCLCSKDQEDDEADCHQETEDDGDGLGGAGRKGV